MIHNKNLITLLDLLHNLIPFIFPKFRCKNFKKASTLFYKAYVFFKFFHSKLEKNNPKAGYARGLMLGALFLPLAFLFAPSFVFALTVSPLRLELKGDPGDTVFGNFKIFNDQAEAKKYYISFRTFAAKDESGEPDFPNKQDEFVSWIEVAPDVTIPGRDFKELTFKINIPQDAEAGAHFAAILASPNAPAPAEDGNIRLTSEVGTLILFRVNGDFKEGARIAEFDTKAHQHTFTELPVEFYYRFQNGGNDYIKPLGDVIIKNLFGSISKIIPANKDRNNVLPGTIRKLETAWLEAGGVQNQSPDIQTYAASTSFWGHVIHQWNNFAFGKYTAQLNLAYGTSSDKAVTADVSFWVIPWHLLLVVFIVLAVFLGGMVLIAVFIAFFFIKLNKSGKKRISKKVKSSSVQRDS